jgi:RNA polymerase sigma-70 factor, ECF subfamily
MDIETVFREERARALATLIRLLGDFDLAEESLQDAFAAALVQWQQQGTPQNPRAWLVSTARHRGIDRIRRQRRFAPTPAEDLLAAAVTEPDLDRPLDPFPDDRLRLIFTCCHPALSLEAQVALTLKTLGGLEVDEIARAFLVAPATMAQRLVRAKNKIRAARIPYEVPSPERLGERLEGVLRVLYLLFNEGYAPTSGGGQVRADLCAEAVRLARLLTTLLPGAAEAGALLALLLLQGSRQRARFDARGDLVTLEEQDRALWDRAAIAEGAALAEAALRQGGAGFYAIQAAIAALHAQAPRAADTDWRQVAILYAVLLRLHPSPVVALNRAAAVGMADGPREGLRLLAEVEAGGALEGYHLLPAAKADLLRRLGRGAEAAAAYDAALALAQSDAERRYLERRRREVAEGISGNGTRSR